MESEESKMEEDNAPTWSKFFKLLHYVGALLYVVGAGTVIIILRSSEWHTHLVRFMGRTWLAFLTLVGSTPSGFVSPIIVSVLSIALTLFGIGQLYGRPAMKKHFWETAAITAVVFVTVMLVVYLPQFAWEVARTTYSDHQELSFQLGELQSYVKDKKKYDEDVRWAQGETRHWQDAYQTAMKGEAIPDRILSNAEEDALHGALFRLSKDSKNKDYATTFIASVQDREARHLWTSLDERFRAAHWTVPLNSSLDKKLWEVLNNNPSTGIVIYTDDMNKGTFLMLTLHNAAHLDSQVNSFSGLGMPNIKGTLIWIGYKQWP